MHVDALPTSNLFQVYTVIALQGNLYQMFVCFYDTVVSCIRVESAFIVTDTFLYKFHFNLMEPTKINYNAYRQTEHTSIEMER